MKAYRCKRCKGVLYTNWGQRRRCVVCDVKSNWHIAPVLLTQSTPLSAACMESVDQHIKEEAAWEATWLDELV